MGNGCTSIQAVKLNEQKQLLKFKLVFIGDSNSGKTSVISRYELNKFNSAYQPTQLLNIVSLVKKFNLPAPELISLEFWEIPEHENREFRKSCFNEADAFVVVVDVSNEDFVDEALRWKQEVVNSLRQNNANTRSFKPGLIPVLLLGNKYDIAKEQFIKENYSLFCDPNSSKVTFDLSNDLSHDVLNNDVINDVTGHSDHNNSSENILKSQVDTKNVEKSPDNSEKPAENGKKSPDNSKKPAENGENSAKNGKKPAENSEKPAENGKKSPDNSEKPAENGETPAENGKKSPDNSKKPAENGENSAKNGKKPAENSEKPAENGKKSPDNSEKPAENGKKSPDNREKPAENGEKPAENGETPEEPSEKQAENDGPPAEPSGKPTEKNDSHSKNIEQSLENSENSAENGKKTEENAEKPKENNNLPVKNGENKSANRDKPSKKSKTKAKKTEASGKKKANSSDKSQENSLSETGEQSPETNKQEVENGSTESTKKTAENGEKTAENGEKTAENGKKLAENGEKSAENGEKPTKNGEKPTKNGEKPTENGEKPTENGKQPVDNGKQPVENGEQPVSNGKQPVDNGKQPVDNGEQPVSNGKQPVSNGKQPVDGENLSENVKTPEETDKNSSGNYENTNGVTETKNSEEISDQKNKNKKEQNSKVLDSKSNGNPGVLENNISDNNAKKKYKKVFPKDLVTPEIEEIIHENGNSENKKIFEESKPNGSVITTGSLLPPCVETLENFAEENGFVAGILVHASDSKGGIHEALHSLIRHLVANKSRINSLKADEISMKSQLSVVRKKRKKKISMVDDFEPIQEVGIIEIDEVLRKCNEPLQQAETMTSQYREAIHNFKRECYKHHVTGGRQVSIEECISALKDCLNAAPSDNNIRTQLLLKDDQQKFFLVAVEMDGFVNLQVVDGNHDVVETVMTSQGVSDIIDLYQTKVHRVCCNVVENGEELEKILEQLSNKINETEEKAWDTAVAAGHSQSNVRRILSSIAQCHARLRGTMAQVKDTRRSVTSTQSRIRASLLF